jgi:hypothetical protein
MSDAPAYGLWSLVVPNSLMFVHGAERGTPTPMSSLSMPMSMTTGCAMAPAEPATKAKAKPGHDHSKFHKLM